MTPLGDSAGVEKFWGGQDKLQGYNTHQNFIRKRPQTNSFYTPFLSETYLTQSFA